MWLLYIFRASARRREPSGSEITGRPKKTHFIFVFFAARPPPLQ